MGCTICSSENYFEVGTKNRCRIVRCASCGFYYLDPLPTVEKVDEIYGEYWANHKNIGNAKRKIGRFKRKIWPLTKLTSGREFLDIGCNIGFAVEAARRLGCSATGIDLSSEAIAIATDLFPANRFFNVSSQDFVSTGKSFDIIVCSEVIEHLTEVHSFMHSIRCLLKQGGFLYLTTPDAGHFRVPNNFLSWDAVIPPEHTGFFTKKIIKQLFAEHGLRVVYFQPMLKPNIRVVARRVSTVCNWHHRPLHGNNV